MTKQKYNGWHNWATWNTELWIDNDEPMYRAKIRFIRQHTSKEITGKTVSAFVMGELMPNGTPDFDSVAEYADVRWGEIAASWRAERREYR
jgi:hypothetical protein